MTAVVGAAPRPSRMRARARVCTEIDARGRSRLSVLRSQAPLTLRPTLGTPREPWAPACAQAIGVCLAAAAAGPVGGDQLDLEVEVGAGTILVLTEAASTLLLPGVDGAESRIRVRVTVETGATFAWLPQPVIAVAGCHHLTEVTVDLAADARLLLREELLLGRRHQPPGVVRQRVRIRRAGRLLHAQDLDLTHPGERSPAVVGSHRAIGSVLVVAPDLAAPGPMPLARDGYLMPLAGGRAVLVSALAGDNLGLQEQLDIALGHLGLPWQA